jgi:hypothetical protein
MKKNKSILQKSTLYFSIASFLASVGSIIYLMLEIDTLGWQNPITASLLASSFFFASVGLLLGVIYTTDIPSFKVNGNSD